LLFGLLLALAGCGRRAAVPGGGEARATVACRFVDVAREVGITFRHQSGRSGRLYLPETMGSGCAFLDYDGDGHLDLFLVNSSRLPGFTGKGPFYPALYRNLGNGSFEDVTKHAGLDIDCYGMGVAVGDFDNDGHPDLYLTAMGPNHLFHNNGDGTFTDVTARARVGDPRWSSSAAWLDYDRDGRLDLFVCNYCRWNERMKNVCPDSQGRRHICTPNFYEGSPSTLYHNEGDGVFKDVTRAAGVYNEVGKSLALAVFDENDDGWPDLAIANDLEPDLLYRNNRDGTFSEIGVEAGIAYSASGRARAGMGIDTAAEAESTVASGTPPESILVGNFSKEMLGLYRGDGSGHYGDAAMAAGVAAPSGPFLTFAVLFSDYDLDGRPDILTANGHIDENVQLMGEAVTFRQRMMLFHNEGGGRYQEIGERAGPGLQGKLLARGIARGDFDEDGDPDFLVSANNGPPLLLRNEAGGGGRNHWLHVRAIGTRSNRSALGTRIVVEAGGRRQVGWIRSGSSYCSQSEPAAHFGLGAATRVDRMEIRWPNGAVETRTDVAADQRLVVTEGGR
jgi:enediyne biosynthesis protein E4